MRQRPSIESVRMPEARLQRTRENYMSRPPVVPPHVVDAIRQRAQGIKDPEVRRAYLNPVNFGPPILSNRTTDGRWMVWNPAPDVFSWELI